MKSVLISIKPKWCELIVNGKKTIEVRKTKPKLDTPFKCYIYCTNDYPNLISICNKSGVSWIGNGNVIGEFVCDNIFPIWAGYIGKQGDDCLTYDERETYLGEKGGYGWHISNLKIYDMPKELNELNRYCDSCAYPILPFQTPPCDKCPGRKLKIAPQSYCYVEE